MNRTEALKWCVDNPEEWPGLDDQGFFDLTGPTPEGWHWGSWRLELLELRRQGEEPITKHDVTDARLAAATLTVDIKEWAAENIKHWPCDITVLPSTPKGWTWGGGFEHGEFILRSVRGEIYTRSDWSTPSYMIDDSQLSISVTDGHIDIRYKGADRKKGIQTLIKYLTTLEKMA